LFKIVPAPENIDDHEDDEEFLNDNEWGNMSLRCTSFGLVLMRIMEYVAIICFICTNLILRFTVYGF
jgi:hypothetical protein